MAKQKGFNISIFISSFFYTGFFPYAPGTAGSVAAFLLYISILRFLNPYYYIALCAAIFIFGVYFSSGAEKISGIKDPSFVVIDETVGYLTVMIGVLWLPFSILYAVYGFILFRFFDILKPFPVRYVDKNVEGGLGVMLDDIVAALFAILVLRFVIILTAHI